MTTLTELREHIMNQMPPEIRFAPEDSAVIVRHKHLLLSWEADLVKKHYDMLYAHPPTAKIFREGERERLEEVLSKWWRRLVIGPIDDNFWNWMTYVGLTHVSRKVKNPMMIAAWGGVAKNVIIHVQIEEEKGKINAQEAKNLTIAFVKLGKIFTSLVAESYMESYLAGLAEATGTNLKLLEVLASQEIGSMMERSQGQLGSEG
jgi:hypothetical protein